MPKINVPDYPLVSITKQGSSYREDRAMLLLAVASLPRQCQLLLLSVKPLLNNESATIATSLWSMNHVERMKQPDPTSTCYPRSLNQRWQPLLHSSTMYPATSISSSAYLDFVFSAVKSRSFLHITHLELESCNFQITPPLLSCRFSIVI